MTTTPAPTATPFDTEVERRRDILASLTVKSATCTHPESARRSSNAGPDAYCTACHRHMYVLVMTQDGQADPEVYVKCIPAEADRYYHEAQLDGHERVFMR